MEFLLGDSGSGEVPSVLNTRTSDYQLTTLGVTDQAWAFGNMWVDGRPHVILLALYRGNLRLNACFAAI
jgi:hypothetical protein